MRLVALLVILSACAQPRSTRCKQICARESECVTTMNHSIPFDEKECVATCTTLETDVATLNKVQRHAECVAAKPTCGDVLACP